MKKLVISIVSLIFVYLSTGFNTVSTTILVTNTNDSGPGSLREAAANAVNGDTIRFAPNLIASGSNTITLSSDINFGAISITIKGLYNDTDTLYISGGNTNRIFSFEGAGKVILDSLAIINGNGTSNVVNNYGGAVMYYNGLDTLHINNCVIKNNTAVYGGGAICSYSSVSSSIISINNSNFESNITTQGGGGAVQSMSYATNQASVSSVIVNHSWIHSNRSSSSGGGIFVFHNAFSTSINLNNSTISGNTALYNDGGGILVMSAPNSNTSSVTATATINNCTLTGNTANGNGGGIYISNSSAWGLFPASLTIHNSTITENYASNGGGIYAYGTPSIYVSGSIVANNSAYNFYNNETPVIYSNGYNIFSDNLPEYSGTGDQVDITETQLNLEPLAYNGGLTPTLLPGSASVAINNGDPTDLSDAQNGPVTDGHRDVGAAERSVVLQVSDEQSTLQLSIYPNPSNGKFILTSNTKPLNLNVYNIDGKSIIENIQINNYQNRINLGTIKPGIYFMKITGDKKQSSIPILIKNY